MAPPVTKDPATVELERLAAENKRMAAELAAMKKQAEAMPTSSKRPDKVMGTKSYRLTQAHYRQGTYYNPGDIITVTDEVPGKTWVPVEAKPVVQMVSKPEAGGRAADQQV